MTRVLVSGGSGFIAAHVLDILLKNGFVARLAIMSKHRIDKDMQTLCCDYSPLASQGRQDQGGTPQG